MMIIKGISQFLKKPVLFFGKGVDWDLLCFHRILNRRFSK